MGKIFGISDLPVSVITTPFEPVYVPKTLTRVKKYSDKVVDTVDNKWLNSAKKVVSNPIIKKRFGFGKLMKHFSKSHD